MIVYDLSCHLAHRFEGWFGSPEDFSGQLEKGLLSCPVCASGEIRRVPSAVAIGSAQARTPSAATTQNPAPASGDLEPAEAARMVLRAVRQFVKSHAEDVGDGFAREARRIHNDEAPSRFIQGRATRDEVSELIDEGIDILPIPKDNSDSLN